MPDVFREADAAFAHACRTGQPRPHFFGIGDSAVRLELASPALDSVILPAFAHLATEPTAADLTIRIGDMASAGISVPFPGGDFNAAEPPGSMRRHDDGRFFALAQRETESLSLLDTQTGAASYWTRNAARLPWQEATFPLRHLLARFFRPRGRHILHAAAVGNEQGAVLIVGRGGSGKSTTTLSCATHGLSYLGDDYTLAGIEPEPRVWSLYSSAKVNADSLGWFPQLRHFLHHTGGSTEKSSLLLRNSPTFRLTGSRRIRAILWPRITGRTESKLCRASASTLLLALAPSSILQTPGDSEVILRALGRLVQIVPTHILDVGTDPEGIAAVVRHLLHHESSH